MFIFNFEFKIQKKFIKKKGHPFMMDLSEDP